VQNRVRLIDECEIFLVFLLLGLKDQLAAADTSEAQELQAEVEELEDRIEKLTSFKSGTNFE